MKKLIPEKWRCEVTVTPTGGIDRRGRVKKDVPYTVKRVLVASSSSIEDKGDMADYASTRLEAFFPTGTQIRAGDQVSIPQDHPCAGVWEVLGVPEYWHSGVKAVLSNVGGRG